MNLAMLDFARNWVLHLKAAGAHNLLVENTSALCFCGCLIRFP